MLEDARFDWRRSQRSLGIKLVIYIIMIIEEMVRICLESPLRKIGHQ